MPRLRTLILMVVVLACSTSLHALEGGVPVAATSAAEAIHVDDALLSPDFWTGRLHRPDRVGLDATAIAAHNAALMRQDTTVHDLRATPGTLTREQIQAWLGQLKPPGTPLFDANGVPIPQATIDAILANRNLDGVPAGQPARFGLVVERAPLRGAPTNLRVFSRPDDNEIDRLQETALFPGTAVVIAHASRDGRWWFVQSPRYTAWVEKRFIAQGTRQAVLDYVARTPVRVVTAGSVRTSFAPDAPRVSEVRLDMGARLPLAALPAGQPVNGQLPAAAWAILLPVRNADGTLAIEPALIPRSADTAASPLPLTPRNIIRQSFKFLGERYGWGHADGGRDCSGFVADVFSSMGLVLPRNTGDQAIDPALPRTHLANDASPASRATALSALRVGDLLYVPGHTLLVIGRVDGEPFVIHDIHDGKVLDANGMLQSLHLNGVSVTPLMPLRLDASRRMVDAITDIVHAGGAGVMPR